MCVCSLSYPAPNAHEPYYIAICGLSDCTIPHYFTKGGIFRITLLSIKCMFWLSLPSLRNISHSKNCVRYIGHHVKYPLFLLILSYFIKLKFSWAIFNKYWISKFYEICPVGAKLFQTDRHDDANNHVSQFCDCVKNRIFEFSSWASIVSIVTCYGLDGPSFEPQ